MNRIKEAKRILAGIEKPANSFDLKYRGMTGPYAWDHFFRLFCIGGGAVVVRKAEASQRNLDPKTLLKFVLEDLFTRLATTASDYTSILAFYGDIGYQGAYTQNEEDIDLLIDALRGLAKQCIDLAVQNNLTKIKVYIKYEAALEGLLDVSPKDFFDVYLPQLKPADSSDQTLNQRKVFENDRT